MNALLIGSEKNDADQLVKKQKEVISIEGFYPLGFDFILAELIVQNLLEKSIESQNLIK